MEKMPKIIFHPKTLHDSIFILELIQFLSHHAKSTLFTLFRLTLGNSFVTRSVNALVPKLMTIEDSPKIK